MLIVLEGPDGSGKSTLAQHLAWLLNAEIIHCTKDTPNDFAYFQSIISASKTRNIIADRFCYGQFVYQNEKERNLTQTGLYELEAYMVACGVKVVYVTSTAQKLKARLDARNEIPMYPIPVLLSRFEAVMEKATLVVEEWRT